MKIPTRPVVLIIVASASLALGWLVGQSTSHDVRGQQAAVAAPVSAFPMVDRVASNIYLQTAAEYRALCLQTYVCATDRLAVIVQEPGPSNLPPAVVMDLDETVFDNSAFQTYLYRTGQEYEESLWQDYERNYPQDVTLIPGAAEFINKARDMHATVVFLSNRLERNRASTLEALQRLGLSITADDQLLLQTDTSDKTVRRAEVATRYNVLMFLGDNLRDFSEVFRAQDVGPDATVEQRLQGIAERYAKVDENDARWGHDWFILPNPVYGEWDKARLIGTDPDAIMRPTSMLQPAAVDQ